MVSKCLDYRLILICFETCSKYFLGFPVAQLTKNLPTMRETWVWSLGWEDPLEEGKATHSSTLAWRIPWTVQSMGWQRVGHHWATSTFKYFLWVLGRSSTLVAMKVIRKWMRKEKKRKKGFEGFKSFSIFLWILPFFALRRDSVHF